MRAGALLRLGRALIKSGKRAAAIEAYERLAALGEVRVAGAPAELVGRHARAKLLAARAEADSLRRDLETGRWALTRGQFAFYWSEVAPAESLPAEAALAEAAAAAWAEFQRAPGARGLLTAWIGERPWFLLRRASGGRQATLIGPPERLIPGGTGRFLSEWLDGEGRVVAGRKASQGRAVVRLTARTQLPWTLSATQDQAGLGAPAGRERLLLVGLAVMIGWIGLGSYFMARAIRREAAVARLQSDFVSAVSHEFRSPLTALRHLSEMLALGRVPDEERRLRYYETLVSETRRLQRLVESLLNFGRLEAGATPYRSETLDPAALVERVAAEFEPFVSAAGRSIEVSAPGNGQRVEADPEALALALRNLIDNALKYSPGRPAVWVECAGDGPRVAIRVRDEGLGISPGERRAIFRKFVRGSAAGKVHAKGTGVGLAMVQRIVRAHGGEIQLESEPGRGSTFTVLLPAVKSL
jgi:signal transduction histidine kinase